MIAGHEWIFVACVMVAGLLAGLVVHGICSRLPEFLERQWNHEAYHALGLSQASDVLPPAALSARKISSRLCSVVIVCCLTTGYVAFHYGVTGTAAAAVFLTWGLLTLSLIDLDHQLLPDVLVLPLIWLGLIGNSFNLFTSLDSAVWGAVAGYSVLWLMRALSRLITVTDGMGQGDFKLFALLGAWGGWQILPLTLLLSSIGACVIGLVLVQLGKLERTTPMPFGPFLALSGWAALLWMPGTSLFSLISGL